MEDEDEIIEPPKDEKKERIKKAVEDISQIINKYEEKKEIREEEIINEIISYINEKNLDCMKILDKSSSTLAHKYCSEQKYFHLKIYLLTIEKIISDKNKFNEYLLIEDITSMNIFEASSEMGDKKIFQILIKYLENNEEILLSLINKDKNNIFHISARLYLYYFFLIFIKMTLLY